MEPHHLTPFPCSPARALPKRSGAAGLHPHAAGLVHWQEAAGQRRVGCAPPTAHAAPLAMPQLRSGLAKIDFAEQLADPSCCAPALPGLIGCSGRRACTWHGLAAQGTPTWAAWGASTPAPRSRTSGALRHLPCLHTRVSNTVLEECSHLQVTAQPAQTPFPCTPAPSVLSPLPRSADPLFICRLSLAPHACSPACPLPAPLLPRSADPLFICQIISSAIVNAPPPHPVTKMLMRTNFACA